MRLSCPKRKPQPAPTSSCARWPTRRQRLCRPGERAQRRPCRHSLRARPAKAKRQSPHAGPRPRRTSEPLWQRPPGRRPHSPILSDIRRCRAYRPLLDKETGPPGKASQRAPAFPAPRPRPPTAPCTRRSHPGRPAPRTAPDLPRSAHWPARSLPGKAPCVPSCPVHTQCPT